MTLAGLPEQEFPSGALYVVGMPIGNLADISLRALWLLAKADWIAAEDTRETKKVLERFGITTKLISVHEHNERESVEQLSKLLSQGQRVALVTDAGTPAISDPGARVVDGLQHLGYKVIPIPGASAVVTAMSASGILGSGFYFVGFIAPQAKARQATLKAIFSKEVPFVLYEAPHRIKDLLLDIASFLDAQQKIVIARELTKKFETIVVLTKDVLEQWVSQHEPRGEYVILVDASSSKKQTIDETTACWLNELQDLVPASKLAAIAAKVSGLPRKEFYSYLLAQKED